jgi:threonine dehydratase
VQATGATTFAPSLAAGRPITLPSLSTVADGIAVARPGALPFAHAQQQVSRFVSVTDEEISRAVLFCLERAKMVVEPAGAASVAALLTGPATFEPPVVAILSGGNIDPVLLQRVIEHGLAAAGRYLTVTVRAPDRPGSLATLLRLIADAGGNVLDVWHFRHESELMLGEAQISFSVETKGAEHSERLLSALPRFTAFTRTKHTVLVSEDHDLDPIPQPQLGEDAPHVRLYCAFGHAQMLSDLHIGGTARHLA